MYVNVLARPNNTEIVIDVASALCEQLHLRICDVFEAFEFAAHASSRLLASI